MCRIPRVILVAPSDRQPGLRRALSSLEYEIVAAVDSAEAADGITGDVAVVWEPDARTTALLRALGRKVVAVGGETDGADMAVDPDDLASFRSRIWELFRPS